MGPLAHSQKKQRPNKELATVHRKNRISRTHRARVFNKCALPQGTRTRDCGIIQHHCCIACDCTRPDHHRPSIFNPPQPTLPPRNLQYNLPPCPHQQTARIATNHKHGAPRSSPPTRPPRQPRQNYRSSVPTAPRASPRTSLGRAWIVKATASNPSKLCSCLLEPPTILKALVCGCCALQNRLQGSCWIVAGFKKLWCAEQFLLVCAVQKMVPLREPPIPR